MRLVGGSAVLSMVILWFGVTTRGKLSTKQALAARCSVLCTPITPQSSSSPKGALVVHKAVL